MARRACLPAPRRTCVSYCWSLVSADDDALHILDTGKPEHRMLLAISEDFGLRALETSDISDITPENTAETGRLLNQVRRLSDFRVKRIPYRVSLDIGDVNVRTSSFVGLCA
jgi:hypothetical protein